MSKLNAECYIVGQTVTSMESVVEITKVMHAVFIYFMFLVTFDYCYGAVWPMCNL